MVVFGGGGVGFVGVSDGLCVGGVWVAVGLLRHSVAGCRSGGDVCCRLWHVVLVQASNIPNSNITIEIRSAVLNNNVSFPPFHSEEERPHPPQ